jgi:hypothetical protein
MLSKIANATVANTTGRHTDWDKVTRAVLKTAAKCSPDVPDMVNWYKKFGGGTSKTFVTLISSIRDQHVDPTRQVSGSFFKSLANLKFAADESSPSHFVSATLIVHAAAKEAVSDGYAKFIKQNELDSMSVGGKRHDMTMTANERILRANRLSKETGLPEHVLLTAKFNLMDRLVRLVFKYDPNKESKDVDPQFTTFDSISAEFVKEVLQLAPTADIVAPPSGEPASSSGPCNLVEYDDAGVAVGQGRATLLNKGFATGSTAHVAQGKADVQWEINSIADNGDVTLCRINREGIANESLQAVSNINEFLNKL